MTRIPRSDEKAAGLVRADDGDLQALESREVDLDYFPIMHALDGATDADNESHCRAHVALLNRLASDEITRAVFDVWLAPSPLGQASSAVAHLLDELARLMGIADRSWLSSVSGVSRSSRPTQSNTCTRHSAAMTINSHGRRLSCSAIGGSVPVTR
jgi:hypothetical protein